MDGPQFASGGIVQPAQDGDSVPLMLDNGYVLPRSSEEALCGTRHPSTGTSTTTPAEPEAP